MAGNSDTIIITALCGALATLASLIAFIFKQALDAANAQVKTLQDQQITTTSVMGDGVKALVSAVSSLSETLKSLVARFEEHSDQTNKLMIVLEERQRWEQRRAP